MPVAIALIVLGWVLAYQALKGLSLTDVFSGATGELLDPKGGRGGNTSGSGGKGGSGGINQSPGSDAAQGNITGTPKAIIDSVVVPLAARHGMATGNTAAAVAAANARHGPTITGSKSDHQGPPDQAWAADMSNGGSPTPEMDALARDIARAFGLKWTGSGAVSGDFNGYRVQLIYRSMIGGNHYNHVHFGIRKA